MDRTLDFKGRASENIFIIRGFAIFLVVIGHVIGGKDTGIRQLYDRDILLLAQLYDFIYTFHMPIFFLASGFSATVLSKSNNKLLDFIKSRCRRLLVPLICWAPLYYIFRSMIGKTNFQVFGILKSIVNPDFIFWFFPAIFFANVMGFIFIKIFRSWSLYGITSLILFGASFPLTGNIGACFYFNIFYFLGCAIGLHLSKKDYQVMTISGWKIISILLITISVMYAVYFWLGSEHLSGLLAKFINGLLSFSVLYIIIDSRAQFSLPNFMQSISKISKNIFLYLGKISMSIYLLHVVCASTLRIVLVKLGVFEPNLQFVIGFVGSIVGSVLIHRLLCKNYLFLYSIGEAK
jgi:fucose 4-O-acetylase-like acetyltransferase